MLGQVGLGGPECLDLLLERYTLEPGASSAPMRRAGTLTASVAAGELGVTAVDGDVWIAAPMIEPAASPAPTPRGAIVQQITITGPGSGGARFRARSVDRSGRVVGARIPTERELRFVAGYDDSAPCVGPAVDVPCTQLQELLLRWGGSGCGPHVRIVVAKAFDAIHIIERSPGCDAARVGHAIVLRIAGRFYLEPRDIEATQECRIPR